MLRQAHHFLYRPPTPFHPQLLPHPHKCTHFTIHPTYPTTLVNKNGLSTRQDRLRKKTLTGYNHLIHCIIGLPISVQISLNMSCHEHEHVMLFCFSFSGQGLPLWHMLILSNRTQSVISDDMVREKSSWRYRTL